MQARVDDDTMNWEEPRGGQRDLPPERNHALEVEELQDHVRRLQSDLNRATQERQSYAVLSQQLQALTQIVEDQRRMLSVPSPGGTTPPATSTSGRIQEPVRYEKPRLPDVEVFEKGSHEDYTQWKTRVQAKLFADQRAYPSESDQVHYVITRTKGWAFTALRTYVTALMEGRSSPSLQDLWQQLDGFFIDPTIKEKAMQFLRTTKQGKGDLIPHVQSFDLKFLEAGLDSASDAQKIDYLKNSLNKRLLRYQVGYQPPAGETYEQFVQRMRVTWENLKAVDQSSLNYTPRTTSPPRTHHHNDAMEWTPTIGAIKPRTTREFWGTRAEVQERREKGTCLRCGKPGHRVAQCQTKLRRSNSRTGEGDRRPKVAAISTTATSDSEESGKEEP
jgi:hypothetical protein